MVTGARFQQGTGREKEGRQGVKPRQAGIAVAIDSQEEKRKWAGVIIREKPAQIKERAVLKNRIDTYTISITSRRYPEDKI